VAGFDYLCRNIIICIKIMEKRIRTVWAVSLALAALAIVVQGYWVYNMYRFAIDSFAGEAAAFVLEACEREYELRRDRGRGPGTIIMQRNSVMSDLAGAEGRRDSMFYSFSIRMGPDSGLLAGGAAANAPAPVVPGKTDARVMRLSFSPLPSMSDEELQMGIRRAVTEISAPFNPAALDSVMAAGRPSLKYALEDWPADDSTAMFASRWERDGGLWNRSLRVYYAYSPLERKGVTIRVAVPPQPVLAGMAGQLALAFGLVLALAGCLVFQIRTIVKQQKLGELREGFVNTMVHELKRPVQTLKTFLAFLADPDMRSDGETARQVALDSMFEIDNLGAYLDKLKDIARTDGVVTALHVSRFNLRLLVEKIIRLQPPVAGKEVNISLDCRMDNEWIEADEAHIANVMCNLIENAVKYSGRSADIEVSLRGGAREARALVADNGIGIPAAELQKVFTKFYRASNIPRRDIPGLGLGLSYVKLIAEAHRGRVEARSRAGGGSVFELVVPQPPVV
jgi:two-component system phosphate regulon sensor histidine kinase PhoR